MSILSETLQVINGLEAAQFAVSWYTLDEHRRIHHMTGFART